MATNIYHIFNFPDIFRVLLLDKGALWVFYGMKKVGIFWWEGYCGVVERKCNRPKGAQRS